MKTFLSFAVFCLISAHAASIGESFQSRIINGNNASSTQFPWHVSITGHIGNGQTTLCGGTLLSKEYVLTAAHCVANVPTVVIGMGSNNLNLPQVAMIASYRFIHPTYNPSTFANDVALLRLPMDVTFSSTIQSIRLPGISQIDAPFLNVEATITGYGRVTDQSGISQFLRYARTRIIANAQCAQFYGNGIVRSTSMCTLGYELNAQGPCANDNGGPLFIRENTGNTLVGIASFLSNAGCAAGHPSGYVRISTIMQWISAQSGIPMRP